MVIHHDQEKFTLGIWGPYLLIRKLNNKHKQHKREKLHNHGNEYRKTICEGRVHIPGKNYQEFGNREYIPQHSKHLIRESYREHETQRVKPCSFPTKIRKIARMPYLTIRLLYILLKFVSTAIIQNNQLEWRKQNSHCFHMA